jgi:hypothetical protein
LNQHKIEVDYIIAGYTPVVQVMDKGIQIPFEQQLKEGLITWMIGH